MFVELATDPGAWNIVLWMLVLLVIGSAVLWAVTTFLLKERSREIRDPLAAGPASGRD